jgi:hypothetical protein
MNHTNFLHNDLAWKSFLSIVAKNIQDNGTFYSWEIYGKTQVAFKEPLTQKIVDNINFDKFKAFYLDQNDVQLLSNKFKLNKERDDSVIIPIKDFSLKGRKFNDLRNSVNRYSKLNNITIEDDLRSYKDMLDFLERWDDTCGEKHFQSRTGKNKYFFKNKLHKEGISIFIYDEDKLIAWGVLSKPTNGYSAYVLGKALCYDYKGLAEYADIMLYEKAKNLNVEEVDLGGGKGSVVKYKMKFPKSYLKECYDVRATKI